MQWFGNSQLLDPTRIGDIVGAFHVVLPTGLEGCEYVLSVVEPYPQTHLFLAAIHDFIS